MRPSVALFGGLFDEAPQSVWDTKRMPIDQELATEYGTVPNAPPKSRRAGVVLHPTSLAGPYGAALQRRKREFVTLGVSGGKSRSRGRFATPADFPPHDCSPYLPGYAYDLGVWGLSIVQGPWYVGSLSFVVLHPPRLRGPTVCCLLCPPHV